MYIKIPIYNEKQINNGIIIYNVTINYNKIIIYIDDFISVETY